MNTYSILSWAFFLVAVVSAIVLTTLSSPLIRRYRKVLISVVVSCILLGATTWVTPLAMRRFNPDQSRLVSLDQLTATQWVEPNTNPETSLPDDEIAWTKNLSDRFKFKLTFDFDAQKIISIFESTFVLLDEKGTLRGFDAYSGFNHWSIDLHAVSVVAKVQQDKKLFLMDHVQDMLRISCLDLQNPSLLWQRTIPNAKDGDLSFDLYSQSLLVTTGVNGIWALKSKTGEILWKRPEIYVKTMAIPSQKHLLVFEPAIAKKAGWWYFLDPQTGKTIQKNANVFPEIERLIPIEMEQQNSQNFIARVNDQQLFFMSHADLAQFWSYSPPEKIAFTHPVDEGRYLLLTTSHLLEQRNLKTNDLIWEKHLSDISAKWMRVIPSQDVLVFPSSETDGVMFFRLSTGDYLFTAKTSEEVLDFKSYGDWFYLMSDTHIWAYQHHDESNASAAPNRSSSSVPAHQPLIKPAH